MKAGPDGPALFIISYDLLIVGRMDHEIALCMLAYRAAFRGFLADNDVTAV